MRILIAPDKFAGTLTATQAAAAIAEGWRRTAPGDAVDMAAMSDGGPGFVELLHQSLGGRLVERTVRGPHGEAVPGQVLVVGETAYVESAQACGLALTGGKGAESASSYGVGELLLAAVGTGARRVVVGLGGSGTSDGGAGLLAALGASADRPLDAGVAGLAGVGRVDLGPDPVAPIEIVAASDVDNPLTGLFGAIKVFGGQKGIPEEDMPRWDGALQDLAAATSRSLATEKGAGAAGGLGFALLLLGATRRPGFDVIADAVGLPDRARAADLVVTGEGSFDPQSTAGKVPTGVAALASEAIRPCIVLAGQVAVGAREMRRLGVDAAYGLVDAYGEERALGDAFGALADLAERVARTWSAGASDHQDLGGSERE